ncbi:MAG TPA: YIP1 family protein [Chloroflexia bacterium]|nr:YIP1 family protein [Chloroflexia bacterium]
MSYQPPSQPGGEPTQPVGGGYTPPPPSGGYTPPPSGDYTPPPSGGYTPPPPPGGGYSPPPVAGGPGGSGGQMDINSLIQSYIRAVTKPNVGTYEAEIPNASWAKTLIGVAAVAIIAAIMALISGLVSGAVNAAQMDQIRAQFRDANLPFDPTLFMGGGTTGVIGALTTLVLTPLTFLLGTVIQWGVAKMLGGQGERGGDFGTQAYLSSLSYTPLRIVTAILSIIPCLGAIVGIALPIYQIVCVGFSLQASQRQQGGKAMLAAFVPLILLVLFICGCIGLFTVLLAGAINNAGN